MVTKYLRSLMWDMAFQGQHHDLGEKKGVEVPP